MSKVKVVSVVVDNPSWILPHAKGLVNTINQEGGDAIFCNSYDEVRKGYASFFLGCTSVASPEILSRNKYNLVVHSSDLPKGRGHSPLTWQILEGKNEIPVCLFEAVKEVDKGDIFYRDALHFRGDELVDELRESYAKCEVGLCLRFMREGEPKNRKSQVGEPTYYPGRNIKDSQIDPNKTIAEQFDLLRTVDNEKYPAWFTLRNRDYELKIKKR